MTPDFDNWVQALIQPELELLGYTPINSEIDALGFQKSIANWIYRIEFQQITANEQIGMRFTVNLLRMPIPFDLQAEYPIDPIIFTLPELLRLRFRQNAAPAYYPNWEFADEDSLGTKLVQVMGLLKTYGIPWLEDPKSEMPNGIQ